MPKNEAALPPPLSPDETVVLTLADAGESMMPLGRWEAPVKALAARGLLRAKDAFNYVITDAGHAALTLQQGAEGAALTTLAHDLRQSVEHAQASIQRAIKEVLSAAEEMRQGTGKPLTYCITHVLLQIGNFVRGMKQGDGEG